MSIRLATADDLAAIMAIERASFPSDAWSEAMMAGELASPHGSYLVEFIRSYPPPSLKLPRWVLSWHSMSLSLCS